MDTFLTVEELCLRRIFPTSVEPVKEIFLTIGFSVSSFPISFADPVIMLNTPGGKPACSAKTAKASAEKGV